TPLFGYFHIIHLKHYFTGRITDYRGTIIIFKHIIHTHIFTGEATTESQTAFGGCLLLICHNSKEFNWVFGPGFLTKPLWRKVCYESIFITRKFKPPNINIVWKIVS